MYPLLFLAGVSLAICLALTPLCRDLFQRAGLLDHPDQLRKIHQRPIPRTGGIPIAIAYLIPLVLLFSVSGNDGFVSGENLALALNLLPAAGLIFATGLIDDLFGLRSWQKLLGQITAAGCAHWGGVQILLSQSQGTESWWSPLITIGWLVVCTNAFNLIDGLDGLASGLGLLAALASLVVALGQGNLPLALATAPLAGALLGFLRYNFNPASIFLGDSGSLLAGFLLGCFSVLWSQKSGNLLGMTAPMMALAIPLLDVGLSVTRRFLRRAPIFGADRGHIHHRLLDRGLPPRRAVLLLYLVGAAGALLAVLQSFTSGTFAFLIPSMFLLVAAVFVRNLEYGEFAAASDVLLGGTLRRLMGARIHLRNLERLLDAASTPNDCWLAIRDASLQLGFHHVRLNLLGEAYQEQLEPGFPANAWILRIPLSDRDYVACARPLKPTTFDLETDAFANLLGTKLRSKRDSLRPSGAIDPQLAALAERLAREQWPPQLAEAHQGSAKARSAAPAATTTYCLPSIE